ncbi:MAG: pyridoxal phosphate-dependent aminotransferase [Candidatus Kerfeldbacteria bacterium]|nr:pyridoxal phosphate-dependent aminotransferase [Candidatus Kerfeldbacteria bacterium]
MSTHNNGVDGSATFRAVPATGVIWVMGKAATAGYASTKEGWVNLGQGAPETGPLPDAPDRIRRVVIDNDDQHEYGPVGGIMELREAVARLYNERYREGKMPYTATNVAISPGGRAGLTRIGASLGNVKVGHVLPDYTAYEEMLGSFGTFTPTPFIGGHRGRRFDAGRFREEVLDRGLMAIIFSNPANPTGKLLCGDTLANWVDEARSLGCYMIPDEFYSHYIYGGPRLTVSAAEFVEDVDKDPILIVDGITKNWRYPGWRISWTIGPKEVIKKIISAGSFLDGGAVHPMQLAALPLLDPVASDKEARAIQACFAEKRQVMVEGLRRLGVRLDAPKGSFYCWGNVEALPTGWNTGTEFFENALRAKVICVPGQFFDINPGQRRPNRPGRLENWIRFSFGPRLEKIQQGLEQLEQAMRPA